MDNQDDDSSWSIQDFYGALQDIRDEQSQEIFCSPMMMENPPEVPPIPRELLAHDIKDVPVNDFLYGDDDDLFFGYLESFNKPNSKLPIKSTSSMQDSQYGSGPSRKSPKRSLPRHVKHKVFPTQAQLDYFNKHAETDTTINFKRLNADVLKLPPVRITFKKLDDLPSGKRLDEHAAEIFDIFIRKMIQDAGGNLKNTKYWLNLRHPGYREDGGFWIMHKTYAMADGHFLINAIADVMQSNKEVSLDETMTLTMKIFTRDKTSMAGKGTNAPSESLGSKVLKKFGLKRVIVAGESHCLPKALVIGKLWSDWKNEDDNDKKKKIHREYVSLTRTDKSIVGRGQRQLAAAKKLLCEAEMDPECGEHNIGDLDKLAKHLSNYRIRLWTLEGDTVVPKDEKNLNTTGKGFIGLLYTENHYEFFKPTVENFGTRFCHKCTNLVDDNHWKTCKAKCPRCGLYECDEKRSKESVLCVDCNIHFRSQQCYDAHVKKPSALSLPFCRKYIKCKTCFKIHRRPEYCKQIHECGATTYCAVCLRLRNLNHECIHATPTESSRKKMLEKQENWTMVIYDFESIVTSQDQDIEKTTEGVDHEVNLVAYRIICSNCFGEQCHHCGPMQHFSYKRKTGETRSVVDRFVDFLVTDKRLENAYIVAHNGGNYDHVFLLTAITKKVSQTPDFLSSGTKILNATVEVSPKNVLTFRDSRRFMPMRLSDMPSAFDLPVQDKGYYPYEFNHPDNYNQKGSTLPPIENYNPKYMTEKERAKFEKWYEDNYHTEYDFDEQILSYCENDVEILTAAVCKYMKLCQEMFNNWNPFIQTCTLASYIMFVLKFEHIEEGVVGYIPENGFPVRNNSEVALKYIRWLEFLDPNLKIKHALRDGEHKIEIDGRQYYADAYDPATKEIYEVNGCLWHGCVHCFPDREAMCPRIPDSSMGELYEKTMARQEALEKAGYTVRVKWECEIDSDLKKNGEMNKFFKMCRHAHQLRPREAMYGGRTQPFQTLATANLFSSLEYYDYCSVYPWVNIKGTVYPIGQPHRISNDFEPTDLKKLLYKGLVFCDILPPEFLLLPVLPYRFEGKLIFPLCRSCVECKNNNNCQHKLVTERYLTGVWCTDELQMALDQGYRILRFHEVWHWPEHKWFRGGFFASFMKPLLKQKHEASGWPRLNMTDDEKDDYIRMIKLNDDVEIAHSKIEKNPALRSLAKLFLNSTWGKFAQKPGKVETRIIKTSNYVEIGQFFNEPGYEPKRFDEWDEEHVLVARKLINSAVQTSPFTNVVYGALTTSAARIHLYKALDKIGAERLIYCDTDSVIFRQEKDRDLLGDLKGDSLGMMTNEIPGDSEIVEVVTVAPKVYGMKLRNKTSGVESCYVKAKGITLNSETAKKVNYETLKSMMIKYTENGTAEPLIAERLVFKRGPRVLDNITTTYQEKILRPVTDKGHFTSDGLFEPFGIQHDKESNINNDYEF